MAGHLHRTGKACRKIDRDRQDDYNYYEQIIVQPVKVTVGERVGREKSVLMRKWFGRGFRALGSCLAAALFAAGSILIVPALVQAEESPLQVAAPILETAASQSGSQPVEDPVPDSDEVPWSKRRDVPILLYHNLCEESDSPKISESTISKVQFQEQMALLAEQGFESVSFQQIIDFVEKGTKLPERPVCITFDDGYLSNYEIAYPILKQYGLKATIFAIGATMGNTEHYKDTRFPITPHFNEEQAKEMSDSGLISIQTHTYDMHQWAAYESGGRVRTNIRQLPGESDAEYAAVLKADFDRARTELERITGKPVEILAYPGGSSNWRCQELLTSFGVKATLSIKPGKTVLIYGRSQTLNNMNRFYVMPTTTIDEFLQWVE